MSLTPDTSPLRAPDARAATFAGLLSAGLIGGAWFFQYVLGYAPCIMCYWQRYAHWSVIGLAIATLAARAIFGRRGAQDRGWPVWLGPVLLISAFLASAGLAGYHVGVEHGVFAGPRMCAADVGAMTEYDPANPFAALDEKIKGPSCSDVVWSFLGLSMAGWNMVASLFGAIGVAYLWKRKAA